MESIFLTKKWHTMLLVLSTLFVLASCDDSSDEGGTVTTPKSFKAKRFWITLLRWPFRGRL